MTDVRISEGIVRLDGWEWRIPPGVYDGGALIAPGKLLVLCPAGSSEWIEIEPRRVEESPREV